MLPVLHRPNFMIFKTAIAWLAVLLCFLTLSAEARSESPIAKPGQEKRIIALAPHIVETLFDIGAGEQIVGTVEYADYPEAALSIPRIGGYHGMQIEKLLALQPDMILAWRSGNKVSDLEKMEQLGLPVFYSEPHKISDMADEIRYFGKLTQREKAAEKVALKYEKKLAEIKASQADKSSLKVFYQLWSEPMMSINKNTWIHQLMTLCRAENVFADSVTDYPQLSVENVMIAQPEVIIIPDEKSKKPQPKINWQQWPEIPAVAKNQLIQVNADLLHRYSTRMLEGVVDMCQKLDAYR